MMSEREGVSRRKVLYMSGSAAASVGLAGCMGGGNSSNNNQSGNQNTGSSSASTTDTPLRAGGSSTVYPIASDGASVWNSNPPASDKEYWGPSQYDIDTSKRLADYWAGLYAFESNDKVDLPYSVRVGLSHSGTGVRKVMRGQTDIGNTSAPV
ncbi:MAG: twin-arginine translocation signal domain-containing protein, partial [Halobacteria archaeon]|nr:twin-arginine translocation signal domain-containing protein [Halobacteria archaeon]